MSKAVLVIDMPERCHDCPFLDGDDAWLNDPPKWCIVQLRQILITPTLWQQ